jgi:mRNA interferase MazF
VKRGDFYRVARPSRNDPKRFRVFLVVSRQVVVDSKLSTVICAPVYSSHHGLSTQISVGQSEGLLRDNSVHCDEVVSLPKSMLTNFVGTLGVAKLPMLDRALASALGIDPAALSE